MRDSVTLCAVPEREYNGSKGVVSHGAVVITVSRSRGVVSEESGYTVILSQPPCRGVPVESPVEGLLLNLAGMETGDAKPRSVIVCRGGRDCSVVASSTGSLDWVLDPWRPPQAGVDLWRVVENHRMVYGIQSSPTPAHLAHSFGLDATPLSTPLHMQGREHMDVLAELARRVALRTMEYLEGLGRGTSIRDLEAHGLGTIAYSVFLYELARRGYFIHVMGRSLSFRTLSGEVCRRLGLDEDTYCRGKVYGPLEALADDIAILDVKAMYPSIMAMDGVSPDTVYSTRRGEGYTIPVVDGGRMVLNRARVTSGPGAGVIREMWQDRMDVGRGGGRYMAVKAVTNSLYGFTSRVNSVAGAYVFFKANQVQSNIIRILEDEGYRVVYSDSVTGDASVLARINGGVRILSMRELHEILAGGRLGYARVDGGGVEVLGLSGEGKLVWARVTGVKRVRRRTIVASVYWHGGHRLVLTLNHSIYSRSGGGVRLVPPTYATRLVLPLTFESMLPVECGSGGDRGICADVLNDIIDRTVENEVWIDRRIVPWLAVALASRGYCIEIHDFEGERVLVSARGGSECMDDAGRVEEVVVYPYEGDFYDVETETGNYFVDGALVHNTDSFFIHVPGGVEEARRVEARLNRILEEKYRGYIRVALEGVYRRCLFPASGGEAMGKTYICLGESGARVAGLGHIADIPDLLATSLADEYARILAESSDPVADTLGLLRDTPRSALVISRPRRDPPSGSKTLHPVHMATEVYDKLFGGQRIVSWIPHPGDPWNRLYIPVEHMDGVFRAVHVYKDRDGGVGMREVRIQDEITLMYISSITRYIASRFREHS